MDDGWKKARDNLSQRKLASRKRRRLELVVRSDALREMYHSLVESVLQLYRGDVNDLHSWEHFRTAATKLAEMHRFVKLSMSRLFELGAAEGAAEYSLEFLEKLHEIWAHSRHQDIPFNFLRDYLTQPNDPPPKPVVRTKRVAYRRLPSRHPVVDHRNTTPPTALPLDQLASPATSSTPNSHPLLQSPQTSSCGISDAVPLNDSPGTDGSSGSSEESSTASSCSCGQCNADGTLSSTTEDDEDSSPPRNDRNTAGFAELAP